MTGLATLSPEGRSIAPRFEGSTFFAFRRTQPCRQATSVPGLLAKHQLANPSVRIPRKPQDGEPVIPTTAYFTCSEC